MLLVVPRRGIINIVHECTSGLKFSLWVPPVLDLPIYVLTAPPSGCRMRNNALNDVLVGLNQKILFLRRIVSSATSIPSVAIK